MRHIKATKGNTTAQKNKELLAMEPLISIIIPVYNVKQYLKKCVDSVIAQSYSNLEIVLVDDGSTDGSGALCDSLGKQDSRITVFHKKNGGLSSARNYGIENSHGDYLGFVDSDDYIDFDMYEYLLSLIKRHNADVSGCDLYECYSGKEPVRHEDDMYEVLETVDAIRFVLESKTSMNVVNKLFKSDLFEDVKFTEGITMEDARIMVDLLNNASVSVFTNAQKYYYVRREKSITTLPFNEHSYDAIDVHDYNYNRAIEISPALEPSAALRQCWARFYVLDKMMISDGNYDKRREQQCISFLKDRKHEVLTCSMFTKGRKLAFCALLINKGLYKTIVNRFNKTRRPINA